MYVIYKTVTDGAGGEVPLYLTATGAYSVYLADAKRFDLHHARCMLHHPALLDHFYVSC